MNEDLKRLQKIEYEILMEFKRICEKHNLQYVLTDGTALGAVRHGDFIPWDDDIDVGMLRADYEKFLKIAPSELAGDYLLDCFYANINSPYLFAKIRKKGTIYMEWCHRNVNMQHGVYIDIFPFDNMPNEHKKRKKYFKNGQLLYNIYVLRATPDRVKHSHRTFMWYIKAVTRRLVHYLLCIIPKKYFFHFVNAYFCLYNEKETDYICVHPFNMYPRGTIFPAKEVMFKNDKFPIAADAHGYLTILFGDYMQFPPVSERKGHQPYKFDF